ncbi:phosphoribosylpyrophosphate synthetase [Portibacter lacus]|uniref:Phosphoribosylpyrophosphate synthetase n=1 Tax=Portibacter lacus TaxID=1099794 RepID=A0AA37WD62_9BACT|nr:phosphoribosylpyrophosphate synthetase [Portibacter lacus]GLR17561.1 hypothetical protein GCM10007940_21760 [Portibacter lacus]
MKQNNYDTLSEAVKAMQDKGYTEDFSIKEEGIECVKLDTTMKPSDFDVDQMFRFEGMTNPDDSSVLYAISSEKNNLKGLLVSAYGTYADPMNMEMVQKLKYDPRVN